MMGDHLPDEVICDEDNKENEGIDNRSEQSQFVILPKLVHTCAYCAKEFNSSSNLTQHNRVHTGEKRFMCSVCGNTFTQKITMLKHQASFHTKDKPYQCSECDQAFGLDNLLKRHIKTKHSKVDVKPFRCHECGYEYMRSDHLLRHLQKSCKGVQNTQKQRKPRKPRDHQGFGALQLGETTVNIDMGPKLEDGSRNTQERQECQVLGALQLIETNVNIEMGLKVEDESKVFNMETVPEVIKTVPDAKYENFDVRYNLNYVDSPDVGFQNVEYLEDDQTIENDYAPGSYVVDEQWELDIEPDYNVVFDDLIAENFQDDE